MGILPPLCIISSNRIKEMASEEICLNVRPPVETISFTLGYSRNTHIYLHARYVCVQTAEPGTALHRNEKILQRGADHILGPHTIHNFY